MINRTERKSGCHDHSSPLQPARRVLILTADNDGRRALAEAYRSGRGFSAAESEVSEALHEAYEFVRPEDVPAR
jgi:hypothetical protein